MPLREQVNPWVQFPILIQAFHILFRTLQNSQELICTQSQLFCKPSDLGSRTSAVKVKIWGGNADLRKLLNISRRVWVGILFLSTFACVCCITSYRSYTVDIWETVSSFEWSQFFFFNQCNVVSKINFLYQTKARQAWIEAFICCICWDQLMRNRRILWATMASTFLWQACCCVYSPVSITVGHWIILIVNLMIFGIKGGTNLTMSVRHDLNGVN